MRYLLFIALFTFASRAFAYQLPGQPRLLERQLTAPVVVLSLPSAPVEEHERGSFISRHTRAVGWTLVGGGALLAAGGAYLARNAQDGSQSTLPGLSVVGTGVLAAIAGAFLLSKSGALGPLSPKFAPPGSLVSFAGKDPKRAADLGTRIPLLRMKF